MRISAFWLIHHVFQQRRLFRMISECVSCLWHDLVENLNKLRWQWGFYLWGEAGSEGLSVTVWNGSSTTLSVLIANKHPRNGGGRLRNEALLVSTTIYYCATASQWDNHGKNILLEIFVKFRILPSANEVWGKVIFFTSVCHPGGLHSGGSTSRGNSASRECLYPGVSTSGGSASMVGRGEGRPRSHRIL